MSGVDRERSVSGTTTKKTRTRTTMSTMTVVGGATETTPAAVVSGSSSKATAAAEKRSKSATPRQSQQSSNSRQRSPSPTSPLIFERLKEREELAGLNNRLANYIDRVRYLEKENSQLSQKLSVTEETITRETSRVRDQWERELSDARASLDEVAKDKALHQMAADKYKKEADDLRARVGKAERDAESADKRFRSAQRELEDAKARLNTALSDKNYAEEEARKLRKEVADLTRQLQDARASLETETMKRVEFENKCLTLKEELEFNRNIFDKELTEVKTRKQVEISEIDSKLADEYQNKMSDALEELREQFAADSQNMQNNIDAMYRDKLDSLQRDYDANREEIGKYRSESYELRRKMETMKTDNEKEKAMLKDLEAKIRDLEERLARERERYENSLTARDDTIRALREELNTFRDEKESLLAENVQLNAEISAYRKLLEGEEERLNIASPASPKKKSAAQRATLTASRRSTTPMGKRGAADVLDAGGKRRVMAQSEESSQSSHALEHKTSAKGDLEIKECDDNGLYVQIINKGKRDLAIGSWKIVRYANGDEVPYKFHSGCKAPSKEIISIWSSNASQTHKPPKDFVMKNKVWPVGDQVRTVIINQEGEEVAEHLMSRAVSSQSVYRAVGSEGAAATFGPHGERGENCNIM